MAILDVRSEEDFLSWHWPGSANIPLRQLARRMYELPEKGSEICIYDDDPVRAMAASDLLTERGYIVTTADEHEDHETGPSNVRLWSPSPLVEEAARLAPSSGCALDLACGSGRDAVWLALQGWQVTAIDILPDALANARDLAARNSVQLELLKQDLVADPSLPSRDLDLVTIIRFWHEPLIRAAAEALRPGGLLVIEAFHPSDAADENRNPSRLVTPEQIAAVTPELSSVIQRVAGRAGRHYSQFVGRR